MDEQEFKNLFLIVNVDPWDNFVFPCKAFCGRWVSL